ncbi:GNAT family N-acetyltransferase [Natribacillus halophilus]|uniref:Ribosomal-protein-serine acetyltransferase n=1 Tax=Natribacillus halophilus TaxID=549003 RepID=A0A1G8R3A8_9BACI|nr:GNAT family protein [Natribacillus halophilus]SDJ11045.1 ribosomal-protein-serine acetyltransferase [Natribacillus halophilus]
MTYAREPLFFKENKGDIMFKVPLEEDLYLHLIERHHASELFAAVHHSRYYLRRWLPWVDAMKSVHDYPPVIDAWLQQYAEGRGFQAGIRKDGALVGVIGLHDIDWGNRRTSLGYWLSEHYTGQGIMTKATQAVLSIVFDEYQLNRVQIQCGVNNYESQAIPKRLEFRFEGIVRDGEWLYDHYHDLVQFSLLREDWQQR